MWQGCLYRGTVRKFVIHLTQHNQTTNSVHTQHLTEKDHKFVNLLHEYEISKTERTFIEKVVEELEILKVREPHCTCEHK